MSWASRALSVYDIRQNSRNTYVTLNVRTNGTLEAPVTVVIYHEHGRSSCGTCLVNACRHIEFVDALPPGILPPPPPPRDPSLSRTPFRDRTR